MYDDIEVRLKKGNKLLFSRDSKCLQELIQLICRQNHRVLVLWAFECVKVPMRVLLDKYPEEEKLRLAFDLCTKWARGEVKMPIAKRAILDCHAIAKELDNDYDKALCHAIGQGLATVHVETHAIGLPIYELSAIVFQHRENYQELIQEKIKYYIDILCYFEKNIDKTEGKWADFLLKDSCNKEKLLWEKRAKLRLE